MGQVVSFEDRAVARLRDRLGAAETARADLLAFARGHSEAVESIHQAVLEALRARDLDSLFRTVVRDWPAMLAVDRVVLAIVVCDQGFRIDPDGISHLETAIVDRAVAQVGGAVMCPVARGHALFGRESGAIRAEALIRVDDGSGAPRGLLLLGQSEAIEPGAIEGGPLLEFLGQSLAAMMRMWLIQAPPTTTMAMAPIPPAC